MREISIPPAVETPRDTNVTELLLRNARKPSDPAIFAHREGEQWVDLRASEVVQQLAGGHGELVVLPGEGHLLAGAGDTLRERLGEWVPERLRS